MLGRQWGPVTFQDLDGKSVTWVLTQADTTEIPARGQETLKFYQSYTGTLRMFKVAVKLKGRQGSRTVELSSSARDVTILPAPEPR